MTDRMQILKKDELTRIHDASMAILAETGIHFDHEDALEIFGQNGFRVDGKRVFINEKDVFDALESVPSRFTIRARNPENDVSIGGDDFVFLPTSGPVYVAEISGEQRRATLKDHKNCCRLVQTSPQLNMSDFMMVQPQDLPLPSAHLEMGYNIITLCDKPFTSPSDSISAARDFMEMAEIVSGDKDKLKDQPVMATVLNSMSPLKYTEEQDAIIIETARHRQPLVITNMVMAGSSGPISLPGVLALGNAEILAGLVLAQLAGPGTPVVYGSTSCPMDMKTSVPALGAYETVVIASATIQMARFYNLPCRTGGMLTDSHYPDAQALAEGTLLMSTVVRNGANFILNACGHMGSYISMSFEKWLLDEEVCGLIRGIIDPLEVTKETIGAEFIQDVGIGGQYLTHPKTFEQFKELSLPHLFNRRSHNAWFKNGGKRVDETAAHALAERLAGYEKPPIDSGLEQALTEYVHRKKKENQIGEQNGSDTNRQRDPHCLGGSETA